MACRWKHAAPTSLIEALRLCKDYAREKRQLSVERIAELMGVTADALYKWLATGRMPANLVPVYEHVCGCDYTSRYLAIAAGKIVLNMPTGRAVRPLDVQALQGALNAAVGAILGFAAGDIAAAAALAEIEDGLAGLAWHHGNIERHQQPELDLAP